MENTMKNIKIIWILMIGIVTIVTVSCNKLDPSLSSKTNIIVKSDITPLKSLTTDAGKMKSASLIASVATIDTFLFNIEKIEFDLDDDNTHIDDEEFHVNGPFLINLLSAEVGHGLTIAKADMPNGYYEEIELELERYTLDPKKNIYNHTVYITGQVNGKKLRMWYNNDFDFKIEFPDSAKHVALTGDEAVVYIDFHLNKMLETLNSLDFSNAKDGNGNGIIEIGPNDGDGNTALAHYVGKVILKSFCLDDDDDDDDCDDDCNDDCVDDCNDND
jgi:hypothetical protein